MARTSIRICSKALNPGARVGDAFDDARLERVMREVPRGALALSGLTYRPYGWPGFLRTLAPAPRHGGVSYAGRHGTGNLGMALWTVSVTVIVMAIMLAIIYAGIVHHINPPSASRSST